MIRVLIVDDSPTVREILTALFGSDPEMQVVGAARNGSEAVELAERLQPDVITMDIRMPRMNGFEATRAIMERRATPIVVVSASLESEDLNITFNALRAGALDVFEKPRGLVTAGLGERARELVRTVKLMSEVKVVTHRGRGPIAARSTSPDPGPRAPAATPAPRPTPRPSMGYRVVGIGASTGGPAALARLLSDLPGDFPLPILVAQHLTPGFGVGLADWLDRETALRVAIARGGEPLRPGHVYLSADDRHLLVGRESRLRVTSGEPYRGHRPSATVLFRSLAERFGDSAIGVLLTGMGEDGAEGLGELHQEGALTIAQDEASCIVFGMPRAAIDRGAVREVLSIGRLATRLRELAEER